MELPNQRLRVALWIVAFTAATVFMIAGLGKFRGDWIGRFEEWGYRPSFAMTIGCLEIVGAIALLIPASSSAAALGLIVIMFGGLWTHVGEGDWIAALAPSAMIGLLGFVVFGRIVCGPDQR